MKHCVLKYKLGFLSTQQLHLPTDAEVLTVQWQECGDMTRGLMLWYKTLTSDFGDPVQDTVRVVTIKLVETGSVREDLDNCRFLATVQCPNNYVLHVFVEE